MFSTFESNDELGDLIIDRTEGWYDAKHPSFSCPEIEFVNSIKVTCCPYCGSDRFRKIGHRKDGTQCFRCNSCKRKFNPLTGSIFDSRKIPVGEWIEFLVHLFQYQSIKVASIDNRNAYSTGRYWINKIFEVLKNYQDSIVMGERFWTDETYLKLMPKDLKRDEKGRLLRGLSRNNLCIMTLTDGTRTVLIADGTGKPSRKRMRKLVPHIKPGSHMIDDGEKSHIVLVEELNLTREVHKTAETKGLSDKENPMGLINTVHRFFKRFMKSHGGYSRDELQDWCNLFSFVFNHHNNIPGAIKDLFEMAVSTHKVIRYRELMSKKP